MTMITITNRPATASLLRRNRRQTLPRSDEPAPASASVRMAPAAEPRPVWVAIGGAGGAAPSKVATMPPPSRARPAVADAGVEERIAEVDGQVEQHVGEH